MLGGSRFPSRPSMPCPCLFSMQGRGPTPVRTVMGGEVAMGLGRVRRTKRPRPPLRSIAKGRGRFCADFYRPDLTQAEIRRYRERPRTPRRTRRTGRLLMRTTQLTPLRGSSQDASWHTLLPDVARKVWHSETIWREAGVAGAQVPVRRPLRPPRSPISPAVARYAEGVISGRRPLGRSLGDVV